MALLFAGREFDSNKWLSLKEALCTAIHDAFAPSALRDFGESVFECIVGEQVDRFFQKKASAIAGILEEASRNETPVVFDSRYVLCSECSQPGDSISYICSEFEDTASMLTGKWAEILKERLFQMYASFCSAKGDGCIDIPFLRKEMENICLSFFEEFGLSCLSNYSGIRYRINASGTETNAALANFTKEAFCEYLFRGANSAASILDYDLAKVKSFVCERGLAEDAQNLLKADRLSASIGSLKAWRAQRKKLAKDFPKLANEGFLGRIEYAVLNDLQSQYPGRAGIVMARTIMDFLFSGYFRWLGADRKGGSAFEYYERDLQECIIDAFDRYENWERDHTLFFGPELLEIYEMVKKDEFSAEDFRNIKAAGVPSSKHIVFFIDEKDPAYPLCALCLASSNGAMLLRGEEVPRFMLAESVSNEPRATVINRIVRAMDFVKATDRQLVKEPIPLLFGDRIVIPVQRGVTINILHDSEGGM